MIIYVINTYSAPGLLQPRYFHGLRHTGQKLTTDKSEAIQYAKNLIEHQANLYRQSDVLSKLFNGKLGEKHEDDTLMRYSVGPADEGLYIMLVNIVEEEHFGKENR